MRQMEDGSWTGGGNRALFFKSGERGSIGVVLLFTLPLVIALSVYIYRVHQAVRVRAQLQEAADAAALHAAKAQSRIMDSIAITNASLVAVAATAGTVFVVGHGVALVLDILIVTLPEGLVLHKVTTDAVILLRQAAQGIARFQDVTVRAGEFAALPASQTPLFLSPDDSWIFIPYPPPGVSLGGLALALPLDERGLKIGNIADSALSALKESLASSADNFESFLGKGSQKTMNKLCNYVRKGDYMASEADRLEKKGSTITSARRAAGAEAQNAKFVAMLSPVSLLSSDIEDNMRTGCRQFNQKSKGTPKELMAVLSNGFAERLTKVFDGLTDFISIKTDSIFGFPTPLLLNDGYADKFQVGIIALTCRPSPKGCTTGDIFSGMKDGIPYMAVSQARAFSRSQNKGGDLFIPDFKPKLMPVNIHKGFLPEDMANGAASFIGEGPWAPLH